MLLNNYQVKYINEIVPFSSFFILVCLGGIKLRTNEYLGENYLRIERIGEAYI